MKNIPAPNEYTVSLNSEIGMHLQRRETDVHPVQEGGEKTEAQNGMSRQVSLAISRCSSPGPFIAMQLITESRSRARGRLAALGVGAEPSGSS